MRKNERKKWHVRLLLAGRHLLGGCEGHDHSRVTQSRRIRNRLIASAVALPFYFQLFSPFRRLHLQRQRRLRILQSNRILAFEIRIKKNENCWSVGRIRYVYTYTYTYVSFFHNIRATSKGKQNTL